MNNIVGIICAFVVSCLLTLAWIAVCFVMIHDTSFFNGMKIANEELKEIFNEIIGR